MADKNEKKWFDIGETETSKAEAKRSEPNWKIHIVIFIFLFSPVDF